MRFNYINRNLEDFNKFLYNRKIAIIGLDASSMPIIDYFHRHNAKISVFDNRTLDKLHLNIVERIISYKMSYSLGENCLNKLNDVDLILKSPKYRYDEVQIKETVDRGAILTSEKELLVNLCPGKCFGVFGSQDDNMINLLEKILDILGYDCFFDDNVYGPLLPRMNALNQNSALLLNLKQEDFLGMDICPDVLTMVNLEKQNERFFKTMDEFMDEMRRVVANQIESGKLILNADDDKLVSLSPIDYNNVIVYSTSKKIENGIAYDNKTIKMCSDGLRRHILNVDEKNNKRYNYISNICACIANVIDMVEPQKIKDVLLS